MQNKKMENGMKSKKYNIIRSTRELNTLINNLPEKNECFKFISTGGFSSVSFINFVAERTKINKLIASTLRVGKKELKILNMLYQSGRLQHCKFIVGSLMANDSEIVKSYRYYEDFQNVFNLNKWEYIVINNHSKILLFDTECGKYVLETSSNLNENPKIEQFSFEKDDRLFEFYADYFNELMLC